VAEVRLQRFNLLGFNDRFVHDSAVAESCGHRPLWVAGRRTKKNARIERTFFFVAESASSVWPVSFSWASMYLALVRLNRPGFFGDPTR